MYGGLAAAMQQNNQNAFRVFGLKNELDQQRRANAIQDQGLLWAGQDRATRDADRTRNQGIEDAELKRRGLVFDQGQNEHAAALADREKTRNDRLKAEGLHDVGQALSLRGRLTLDEVKKFNGIGSIKLVESEDAATIDPATGIVRLKLADGGMSEMPVANFFQALGMQVDAGKRTGVRDDSLERAKLLEDFAENRLKDIDGLPEALAAETKSLDSMKARLEELKTGWFNGKKIKDQEAAIAEQEAKIAPAQQRIDKARAKAAELRQMAEAEATKVGRPSTGLTRYLPPGGQAPQAGGLLPTPPILPMEQPTTNATPAPLSPDEARAAIDQEIKQKSKEESKANVEVNAKDSARASEKFFSDKPALPSIPKMRGLLSGLANLNSAVNNAGVTKAVETTASEINADKGRTVIEFVKALGERGFLLAWNTAHPDLAMSKDQWAEFKQYTSRANISPTVEALGKWLSTHQ